MADHARAGDQRRRRERGARHVAARQENQCIRAIERLTGAWQRSSDVEAGLNGVERVTGAPGRRVPPVGAGGE